jgi:hypothetical protein
MEDNLDLLYLKSDVRILTRVFAYARKSFLRLFAIFDLLDRLELDEEDDRVDLVVVQTFNRLKVDPQNAMLVLKENIFFNKLFFCTVF